MLIRVSYCIITGVPNTYCGHPKSTADETTKNRDAVGSGFEHKMTEKNQYLETLKNKYYYDYKTKIHRIN